MWRASLRRPNNSEGAARLVGNEDKGQTIADISLVQIDRLAREGIKHSPRCNFLYPEAQVDDCKVCYRAIRQAIVNHDVAANALQASRVARISSFVASVS